MRLSPTGAAVSRLQSNRIEYRSRPSDREAKQPATSRRANPPCAVARATALFTLSVWAGATGELTQPSPAVPIGHSGIPPGGCAHVVAGGWRWLAVVGRQLAPQPPRRLRNSRSP